MVSRVRKWLDDPQQGNGGPWGPNRYASWGPRITDRRVLLDRYESHTKHCKACSTVYMRMRTIMCALLTHPSSSLPS